MEQKKLDDMIEKLSSKLLSQSIEVEASGRHIHLCQKDVDLLFGKDYQLSKKSDLSQPGQFASNERISIEGPKSTLKNVIILGPTRSETQLEISMTDARILGIKPMVRMSGDIAGTPGIKLIGPVGEKEIKQGVIVAKRHIHMTPEDAKRLDVLDNEEVSLTVFGKRSTTFNEVTVRVSPNFATYAHIDYDEANACSHFKGMKGIIQKRDMLWENHFM